MPTCSFSLIVPVDAHVAWRYVMDYENTIEWDPDIRSVSKNATVGDERTWDVEILEFPSVKFMCSMEAESSAWNGPSQSVTFNLETEKPSSNICIRETFTVEACEGSSRISYRMHIGIQGWRSIPCLRGATWFRYRARSASTCKQLCDKVSAYDTNAGSV